MKAAVSPTGGTTTSYRQALNRAQRKRIAGTIASFAVLLIGWQLFSLTQPSYVFPSLPHIAQDMASFANDGTLWRATWATLKSVVAGSIASLVVGTLAGFALKRHEAFFWPAAQLCPDGTVRRLGSYVDDLVRLVTGIRDLHDLYRGFHDHCL